MSRDKAKWRPTPPSGIVLGAANQKGALLAIMSDPILSPATKNVAFALATSLNWDTGWTYASLDRFGDLVGMRRRDVVRHLAALEGGERPADPRAPKRSERYVYSVRFGRPGGETVYRCFIEPEWVTQPGRDIPTADAAEGASKAGPVGNIPTAA